MIKPKKYIKKYHFGDFDYEKELNRLLNEWSGLVQSYSRRGPANWIVCSPQLADSINTNQPDEIEIGETRIEGDTMIQDIQLRPRRVPQYLNLDINITNTDINFL